MNAKLERPARLPAILFLLVLVGYPISVGLTALFSVEANVLSVAYRILVLTIALSVVLVSLCTKRFRFGFRIAVGAAFVYCYAARMFLEWIVSPQSSSIDWGDFWLFFVLICLLPALPFVWAGNAPTGALARRGVIFFGIIGLIAGFYAANKESGFYFLDQLLLGRLESERLNPIAYGHLAVSVLIVSVWSFLVKKEMSALALTGIICGIAGVLASGSRGPVLSLAVCGLLLIMLIKNRFVMLSFLCFVVGGVALALSAYSNSDSFYLVGRVASSMFEDSARLDIFKDAYHAFLDNFMFGVAYPFDTYPHNIVIEAFMSTGIVGGILMLGVLLVGGWSAIMLLKTEYSWMALLFMQYLLFVMVSSSIYYSNIFWMLWVCMVVLAKNSRVAQGANNGIQEVFRHPKRRLVRGFCVVSYRVSACR